MCLVCDLWYSSLTQDPNAVRPVQQQMFWVQRLSGLGGGHQVPEKAHSANSPAREAQSPQCQSFDLQHYHQIALVVVAAPTA